MITASLEPRAPLRSFAAWESHLVIPIHQLKNILLNSHLCLDKYILHGVY